MGVNFSLKLAIICCSFFQLATSNESNKHYLKADAILPLVVTTWHFYNATQAAWTVLNNKHGSAVDSVVEGCSTCEREQCDGTVGYGGGEDETGETTLDAMVMDGLTLDCGAVADLHSVTDAIKVARDIMKYTRHTMLVGEKATQFALNMGYPLTNLSTPQSLKNWKNWINRKCQPNFWQNVIPDPTKSCGPYKRPTYQASVTGNGPQQLLKNLFVSDEPFHHDTIGMIAIDGEANVAVGTSTNGAVHKIPGRVGDSPIVGAGAYADNEIGGAAATGDGDLMMRLLPSFLAVEMMRSGMSPDGAAAAAVARVSRRYPQFSGAVIAANISGHYGAACHGIKIFPYVVASSNQHPAVQIYRKQCI